MVADREVSKRGDEAGPRMRAMPRTVLGLDV